MPDFDVGVGVENIFNTFELVDIGADGLQYKKIVFLGGQSHLGRIDTLLNGLDGIRGR